MYLCIFTFVHITLNKDNIIARNMWSAAKIVRQRVYVIRHKLKPLYNTNDFFFREFWVKVVNLTTDFFLNVFRYVLGDFSLISGVYCIIIFNPYLRNVLIYKILNGRV